MEQDNIHMVSQDIKDIKAMSFFVDVANEDSFYENLTLGIIKVLEDSPGVKNVRIDRRNGCDPSVITNWEQRHCCILPEDIRNFYISIDGFLLQWNLEITGEEFSIGCMEINCLSTLKKYVSKDRQMGSSTQPNSENVNTSLSEDVNTVFPGNLRDCKLFEISRCLPGSEVGKIYLTYRSKREQDSPSIWLHHQTDWYHLADNFTTYFRMMLVHLGLPLWQYCIAGLPLPTWVEQAYFLIGPHLLPTIIMPTETLSTSLWNNGPVNILDPAIFKVTKDTKHKTVRKK